MFDYEDLYRTIDELKNKLSRKRTDYLFGWGGTVFLNLILGVFMLTLSEKSYSRSEAFGIFIITSGLASLWFYFMFGRSYFKQASAVRNGTLYLRKVENIINERKDYLLYLYDFDKGATKIEQTVPYTGGTAFIRGNLNLREISRRLHKYCPVVFLNNIKELQASYKAYPIIVSTNNWFNYFVVLFHHCKYIVIDYGRNHYKPAIKKEIEYILNHPGKIILFVGTDDDFASLQRGCPRMANRISRRFEMSERLAISPLDHSFHNFLPPTVSIYDKLFEEIRNGEILDKTPP